jgi:hypothetical protein
MEHVMSEGVDLSGKPAWRADGESSTKASFSSVPDWDGQALYFKGRLLAFFKGAAHVIGLILNAFDEQGWPRFVASPLGGRGHDRRQLRNAVDNLNRKLGWSDIRFYLDRTGSRIYWEPLPKTEISCGS